jgi:hypothetical protein
LELAYTEIQHDLPKLSPVIRKYIELRYRNIEKACMKPIETHKELNRFFQSRDSPTVKAEAEKQSDAEEQP